MSNLFGYLLAVYERISRFLAERRLMSFVITSAAILLVADSIRRVLLDESEVNLFTWIALALIVYAVIVTIFLPKRVAPNVRLVVAWTLGVSPALYGFAAVLADSPRVVMWVGVLMSLCLVSWVAIAKTPEPRGRP